MLAPLSNNGGPTLTHRLLPGSPAIDAGLAGFSGRHLRISAVLRSCAYLMATATLIVVIDIGAYELQSLVPPPPFLVDTLVDESDGDYTAGDLSLREAIGLANGSVGVIPDVIEFAPPLSGGTIFLSEFLGELAITDDVVIDAGPLPGGITIDAGNGTDGLPATGDGFRIFNIDDFTPAFIAVDLVGLTLTGGDVMGAGGAISSVEMLTVTGSVVTGNATTGALAFGGGIYAGGPVTTVSGSTISGNSTSLGPFAFGGGIGATGVLVVEDSTIVGNAATGVGSVGGGIWADGPLFVTRSTIAGNSAVFDGGGINTGTDALTIESSTISGNIAGGGGGGIMTGAGTFTIESSTISGNSAAGDGGGILTSVAAGTTSTISHSTLTGNIADTDGSGESGGGIAVILTFSFLLLDHTIVAANSDVSGGGPDITRLPPLLVGGDINLYYSLIGEGTVPMIDLGGSMAGAPGVPIDPLLAPLGNNGGPTLTHRLLPGSPAIDGGDPAAVAGALGVPLYDQRVNPFFLFGPLFPRVDASGGMIIDIGAYELQNVGPLILFVDTLVDESDGNYGPGDLSLREAIGLANGNVGFDDTVSFGPALTSGTIALADLFGELVITEGVFVDFGGLPGGVTIDAGNGADDLPGTGDGFRIFNIEFADPALVLSGVGLSGLTLTGGDVTGVGGAIRNLETLVVNQSTVTGNATSGFLGFGGGIYSGGVLTIINSSTISGNSTSGGFAFGGGIAAAGAGTLMVNESTIAGNATTGAPTGGGGIWAATAAGSALTVTASTISGNTTSGDGGGIWAGIGELTVESSTISGNSAAGDGGGIRAAGSLAGKAIRRSTITGSTAGLGGEGILWASYPGGTLALDHTIVAGNTAGGGLDVVKSIPVVGTITASYSLIGIAAAGAIVNVGGTSMIGAGVPIDPMLGLLAPNGGPTMTHALMAGSPAIEAGDPAAVGGMAGVPLYDQRGARYTRVYDSDAAGAAVTDIGAYELHPSPPVTPALLGDYNLNLTVDTADYILWRNTLGTGGLPAYSGADGDGDGTIDDDDYGVWRANFGSTLPPGAGSGASGEPGAGSGAVVETFVADPHPSPLLATASLRPEREGIQNTEQVASGEGGVGSGQGAINLQLADLGFPAAADELLADWGASRIESQVPERWQVAMAESSWRDDALAAWLAARMLDENEDGTDESVDRYDDGASTNAATDLSDDTLDAVFASLAV